MSLSEAMPEEAQAISELNTLAFGSTAEAGIIRRLTRDKDDITAFTYKKGSILIGHIQLYKIGLGQDTVAGLGPMCVHPDHQKKGIGRRLIKTATNYLKGTNSYTLFFVLGHPHYYPRFGFSSALARHFEAPWAGPAFMAMILKEPAPTSGTLIFPKAFL